MKKSNPIKLKEKGSPFSEYKFYEEKSKIPNDNDIKCSHWLYNRPYVWINNKNIEKCQRLYLVYNDDPVFIHTRKGYPMKLRKVNFSKINLEFSKIENLSMIDLWSRPSRINECKWVSNYFRVFIDTKSNLNDYDVRINGKKIRYKNINTVGDYLEQSGIPMGGTTFLKIDPI